VEIFEAKQKALEEGDEAVTRQIGQGKDYYEHLECVLSAPLTQV
jgi:hypothetical protein